MTAHKIFTLRNTPLSTLHGLWLTPEATEIDALSGFLNFILFVFMFFFLLYLIQDETGVEK